MPTIQFCKSSPRFIVVETLLSLLLVLVLILVVIVVVVVLAVLVRLVVISLLPLVSLIVMLVICRHSALSTVENDVPKMTDRKWH